MSNPPPSTSILLPSRGALYGHAENEPSIPEGRVSLRKWTVQELSFLESQGENVLDRVRRIIDTCVTLPNGFPPEKLLIVDRFAILLAQRVFSVNTPALVYDYRCTFCGQVNYKVRGDIVADFNEKVAADDLVEPLEVKLPDAGKTVALRFLRGFDEEAVAKVAKRMRMASNDGNDPSSLLRIGRQIVNVDGETMNEKEKDLFVKGLVVSDLLAIRRVLDAAEPGIDTTFHPTCKHCGAESEVEMQFSAEFFRPTVV